MKDVFIYTTIIITVIVIPIAFLKYLLRKGKLERDVLSKEYESKLTFLNSLSIDDAEKKFITLLDEGVFKMSTSAILPEEYNDIFSKDVINYLRKYGTVKMSGSDEMSIGTENIHKDESEYILLGYEDGGHSLVRYNKLDGKIYSGEQINDSIEYKSIYHLLLMNS